MSLYTYIMSMIEQVQGAFFGAAIGDALGVPVEFHSRRSLMNQPVEDFIGYGEWNQPPGTFSDDSSLLFCTAESLCTGFDMDDLASRFIQWKEQGYWGAHDAIFDIGGATRAAISRLMNGVSPLFSGGMLEHDNGNGSLMRILPVAFCLRHEPSIVKRYETVKLVSGITHYHFRSVFACFIYVETLISLFEETDKVKAYQRMQLAINQFIADNDFSKTEISLFDRILKRSISKIDEADINSSGYVLDTLESSLWCFLTTSTYAEAVLKAVNLGDDTDTTGTVTGGLAGLFYGYEAIPAHWVEGIVKREAIDKLASRFSAYCEQR